MLIGSLRKHPALHIDRTVITPTLIAAPNVNKIVYLIEAATGYQLVVKV